MKFTRNARKYKSIKLLLYPVIISYSTFAFANISFCENQQSNKNSNSPPVAVKSDNKNDDIKYEINLLSKLPYWDSRVKKFINNNRAALLKKLGYYSAYYNDKNLNLRSAIIHFQGDNNINTDGKWDDRSVNAMLKKVIAPKQKASDKVADVPSEGMWITVNKSKKILTVYNGSIPSKKYPVAVGNPPDLTPSGKFTIVNKVVNPTWGGGGYAKPVPGGSPYNPLGYRWMGLSPKGGSSYGIHGTSAPYSLGSFASHGCIRMYNFDVEALFPKVPVNTYVYVGTDKELEAWGIIQEQ
ncbi:MAG: L,D-transpeptidase family protein [Bacillota bacterium]|nr:L,D-transpeptidase family protein [Bacillota bacterium]